MVQRISDLPMPLVLVAFVICLALLFYVARRVAQIKACLQDANQCYWRAKEANDDTVCRQAYSEMLVNYNKAASLGSAEALTRLGHAYREGWGMEPDLARAFGYYRRAARKGFHEAQYHLSLLYENGQGVPQDLNKAKHWQRRSKTARFRIGF